MVRKTAGSQHSPKPEPLLAQTKRLLRQFNIKARKGLAQHFLVDESVLKLSASVAELTATDVVVEIGPGLGVLTRELAGQAGWVISVEIDSKLAAMLRQTLASYDNITIINGDILTIDAVELLHGLRFADSAYKVVANLPYYIASPVLRRFLEASVKPRIMVVMVQKKVAEAIVAGPGRMSLLSISVQFYGKPKIVGYVPAQSFYPAPEVDSAILRIDAYPEPVVQVTNEHSFFDLVRAGFSASRKQIGNSLAQGTGLPKPEVLSLLRAAGITPQRRAETLSLGEWARLWQVCIQAGKSAC